MSTDLEDGPTLDPLPTESELFGDSSEFLPEMQIVTEDPDLQHVSSEFWPPPGGVGRPVRAGPGGSPGPAGPGGAPGLAGLGGALFEGAKLVLLQCNVSIVGVAQHDERVIAGDEFGAIYF